jgi:hypothetical protein
LCLGAAFGFPAAEAGFEVDVLAADAAFAEQDRHLRRHLCQAALPCPQEHVRQPRRHRECGDRAAVRGRATVFDGIQRRQASQCFVDRGGGRWIDPAEISRIADAPERAGEHQRGQVRLEDFRRIVAREACGRCLFPQTIRDARPEAGGAAGALGDGGLARAFGDQAGHAGGTVVAGAPGQARVDDDADAVESQAGLGDAGGEYDLPPAVGFGEDRRTLGRGIEAAVEFVEDDVVGEVGKPFSGPLDLRDAGEEREHPAFRFAERAANGGGDRVLDPQLGLATDMAERQRIAAAFTFDHGAPLSIGVHQRCKSRSVERCGHRNNAQIGAEAGLYVEREGKTEIAVEAAFVDFVEQHGRDAGEFGVGLDARDEDALSDHRHAGGGGALAVHAGGVAEGAANGFARGRGHALGGGAGGQAAGGQEEYLARAPGFGEEGGGDGGGLARAGGSDQHRR